MSNNFKGNYIDMELFYGCQDMYGMGILLSKKVNIMKIFSSFYQGKICEYRYRYIYEQKFRIIQKVWKNKKIILIMFMFGEENKVEVGLE